MNSRLTSLKIRALVIWKEIPTTLPPAGHLCSLGEQIEKERELDRLMEEIHEMKKSARRSASDKKSGLIAVRSRVQKSIVQLLHGFDCVIDDEMENSFSGVTDEFIRKAFDFDSAIEEEAVYQASRNVMIMNTFQMHLGIPVSLTPSVFAYSLLYPYTDNYLDAAEVSQREKREANRWLRLRLSGIKEKARSRNEKHIDNLVGMIEEEFDRNACPLVYDSLLAIHDAQARSVSQQDIAGELSQRELLDVSFEKGGASVLADGYLVAGNLAGQDEEFFFNFGIILQLIDDLQDLEEDFSIEQRTLAGSMAEAGELDQFTNRLLTYLGKVIETSRAERQKLYRLIERSCRLLILEAVASNHLYYSDEYVSGMERRSPVRFDYLRAVKARLKEGVSTRQPINARVLSAMG